MEKHIEKKKIELTALSDASIAGKKDIKIFSWVFMILKWFFVLFLAERERRSILSETWSIRNRSFDLAKKPEENAKVRKELRDIGKGKFIFKNFWPFL